MENNDLDFKISRLQKSKDKNGINQIINDYMPFVVKTVSEFKNSYVQLENDEELSVALLAFNEAIEKYVVSKGHFISYAKLVIQSRLKNYYISENKSRNISFEEIHEDQLTNHISESNNRDLAEEILEFEKELKNFGFDFTFLTENSPTHKDTIEKSLDLAGKIYLEKDLLALTFEKKRLPIKKISERFFISIKFLKTNKYLIIATLVIIEYKLELISEWIKKN